MARWDENIDESEEKVRLNHERTDSGGFANSIPQGFSFHTLELTETSDAIALKTRATHVRLLLGIPLSILAGFFFVWMGLELSFQLAAVFGILSIALSLFNRVPISIRAGFKWMAIITICVLAAGLLRSRLMASSVCCIATLAVFILYGRKPIDFYHQWIFAAPGLRQDLWIVANKQLVFGPSYLMLSVFLCAMVFIPFMHSVSFALLIICGICVVFNLLTLSRNGTPVRNLRVAVKVARNIELRYIGYPDVAADFLWKSSEAQSKRQRIFAMLWLMLALTIAVSLSYCIPYELFGSWFQPGFRWTVPPSNNSQPFDWLIVPWGLALTASRPYLWALVIGAVLSFVLPYLILFTVYLPILLRAQECADNAIRAYEQAGGARHTFTSLIDQMQSSDRTIETPEEWIP